jgi:hypothetical protein
VSTALKPFFQVAPPSAYSTTLIDYTLDTLFIHLDDLNDKIQDAVLEIIKAMVPIAAVKIMRLAKQERTKQRSPYRCDQLIAVCDEAL